MMKWNSFSLCLCCLTHKLWNFAISEVKKKVEWMETCGRVIWLCLHSFLSLSILDKKEELFNIFSYTWEHTMKRFFFSFYTTRPVWIITIVALFSGRISRIRVLVWLEFWLFCMKLFHATSLIHLFSLLAILRSTQRIRMYTCRTVPMSVRNYQYRRKKNIFFSIFYFFLLLALSSTSHSKPTGKCFYVWRNCVDILAAPRALENVS